MDAKKIIVALDGLDRDQAIMLAWTLSYHVWGFKVNDLLLRYGTDIITELKLLGKVFADPKLYDTPNTVSNSVSRLALAGADLITVHTSGGAPMLKAALSQAGDSRILGVTALTSLDDAVTQRIYHRQTDEMVWDLAHLAHEVGLHGIVCSPRELSMLEHLKFIKVTPGIRLPGSVKDDQNRTAATSTADLVVIGRPITQAADPLKAIEEISAH